MSTKSNFAFGENNPDDPDNEGHEGTSSTPTVADGEYMAHPVQYGLGFTKDQKPQACVVLELIEKKVKLPWYGSFRGKPGVFERTVRSLHLMGMEGDDIEALTIDDLTNDVLVVVKNEEYEGKTRPRIAWINDPSGVPAMKRPMAEEEKREFAAEFRAKLAAVAQESTSSDSSKASAKADQKKAAPKKKF